MMRILIIFMLIGMIFLLLPVLQNYVFGMILSLDAPDFVKMFIVGIGFMLILIPIFNLIKGE